MTKERRMSTGSLPRFVILRHAMPAGDPRAAHWDFMLESSGVLRTWALASEPAAGAPIAAAALAEHRLDYLDYEGPISGNRGHVTRWDSGHFVLRELAAGEVLVALSGQRLRGQARLTRDAAQRQRWIFSFVADPISASAGESASAVS